MKMDTTVQEGLEAFWSFTQAQKNLQLLQEIGHNTSWSARRIRLGTKLDSKPHNGTGQEVLANVGSGPTENDFLYCKQDASSSSSTSSSVSSKKKNGSQWSVVPTSTSVNDVEVDVERSQQPIQVSRTLSDQRPFEISVSSPLEDGFGNNHAASRIENGPSTAINFAATSQLIKVGNEDCCCSIIMNNNRDNKDCDVTPNANAVFFGFIRHPGTRKWRDIIKTFSQNHRGFPSWSDDAFDKIRIKFREHGITSFFVCRKQSHLNNNPSQIVKRKKIFDMNKNYMGRWELATPQEVFDRTKQRFVDDRKPQVVAAAGAKRPRGRPPKPPVLAEPALFNVHRTGSDAGSISRVLNQLYRFLLNCNFDNRRFEPRRAQEKSVATNAMSCLEKFRSCSEQKPQQTAESESQSLVQQEQLPNKERGDLLEVSQITNLMRELEETKDFVQRMLEAAWQAIDAATNISAVIADEARCSVMADIDDSEEGPCQLPNKRAKFTNGGTFKREPCFPILSHHICFGWTNHPGTIAFCEAVKILSDNQIRFPEWTDVFVDTLKAKLNRELTVTTSTFLVLLDEHEQPCEPIEDGLWYHATEREIVEKTRHHFNACRNGTNDVRENITTSR